jgi:hypothetical protein
VSFITVQHQNPGAVTRKMTRWSQIFGSDLVMQTINEHLDRGYEQIYKATPVRTGYLRSTIKVASGDNYAQIAVTARYAIYVDQGRSPRGKRRAQPFWSNNIVGMSIDMILTVRNLFMTIK